MLRYFFKIFIFSFLFSQNNFLSAQTDTSFWFVAPEVTSAHGDRPIYLRFTALNQDASVTITQPSNINFTPISINVSANSSQSVDLTNRIDMIENKPADIVLNYGILIRSTAFITAYYEEASNNNPEIYALKGRNALGKLFFIPSQNIMNNGSNYNPSAYSAFDIVATEDNTVITITPSADILGHLAGVPFNITLNKGQTYSAAAINTTSINHLMGSIVSSTKPIAISIKDDSITGGGYAGCLDLAGEQIIPTTLIGTKYISLPGYLNNPSNQPTDQLFILATENNTSISINGSIVSIINKGQTFTQPSFNNVFFIETSYPVYVLHLSGFGCEVGFAQLPQLDCSGSRLVGFTRSDNSPLYVNILVPNGGEGSFIFNGDNSIINSAQFADVPFSNSAWKYARIQLNTSQMAAGAAAIVKNSSKDFHLSIIHGDAATGCRYGYFSGFNKFDALSISNATFTQPGCAGDTLKLFCDVGAAEGIDFLWIGPNGFSSTLQNPFIANMQTFHAGIYKVIATKIGCNTVIDSTNVIINVKPSVTVNTINPICEKEAFQLAGTYAGFSATFLWTGPNGFSSSNLNNVISNATIANSGDYFLTTTSNFCTQKDTISVIVKPLPIVDAGINQSIIQNSTILLNASFIGNDSLIRWTPNYNLNNDKIITPLASPLQTTTYKLEIITKEGCYAFDEVEIKVYPKIIIPNAFTPNGDGINDVWLIPALTAFPNCEVQIFDRSGKIVFNTKNYLVAWNGKFKGHLLPVATYYYVIQLHDDFNNKPIIGSITILK